MTAQEKATLEEVFAILDTCQVALDPRAQAAAARALLLKILWPDLAMQEHFSAEDALVSALKDARMIVSAHLCPFGIALLPVNDQAPGFRWCDCNYHDAARAIDEALSKAGEPCAHTRSITAGRSPYRTTEG